MAQIYSEDIECKVSAKRMWCGAFKDVHNCLPKALPEKVVCVEYTEGHIAEPGCVRTIKYHKGHEKQHQSKEKHHDEVLVVKEKIVEVNNELLKVKSEVKEGGLLGISFKSYNYTFEFKEGAHKNSCVVHWSVEYEAIKEDGNCHDELKETFNGIFKGVEAYLVTHNDYS